jgi:hypothetical protein
MGTPQICKVYLFGWIFLGSFLCSDHNNFTKSFRIFQPLKIIHKQLILTWFYGITIKKILAQNVAFDAHSAQVPRLISSMIPASSNMMHRYKAWIFLLTFLLICVLLRPINSNLMPKNLSLQSLSMETFSLILSNHIDLTNILLSFNSSITWPLWSLIDHCSSQIKSINSMWNHPQ